MGSHCVVLGLLGQLFVETSRTDFFRSPGFVLRLVVEKAILVAGDNLNQGQRFRIQVAENRTGDLGTGNVFLQQDKSVILAGQV